MQQHYTTYVFALLSFPQEDGPRWVRADLLEGDTADDFLKDPHEWVQTENLGSEARLVGFWRVPENLENASSPAEPFDREALLIALLNLDMICQEGSPVSDLIATIFYAGYQLGQSEKLDT